MRCDVSSLKNSIRLATGAGYKKGSDSILYYTSSTTMHSFWEKGTYSRYDNPLQPEVIKYIKTNRDKLNPWFFKEAQVKGIIKEIVKQ